MGMGHPLGEAMSTKFISQILKKPYHFEGIGVHEKIILKLPLKSGVEMSGLRFFFS
jgi:hypothetical protein